MKKHRKMRISMISLFLTLAMAATSIAGNAGAGLIVYAEGDGEAQEVSLKIDQEYASVGTPLTATLTGAPKGTNCEYQWKVGGAVKSTQESYTPSQSDLEKMLTLTVTTSNGHTGTYQASMYVSKLPVIYVETENNQPIVSKEKYINGSFRIQGNAEYNSANTTLYDGAIEIKGRGNSTWQSPKKPYKIKLDKKTDIFGFGKNKHWVLLANYTDESHMRNMLAYNLSGAMGMPYMQNVHVDLILNGEYQGTYQFCEQIRIADGRVNIQDWEDYASEVAKAVYKAESGNGLTKDDQDAIETQLAEKDMNWLVTKRFTYNGKEYDILKYLSDMPDAIGGFLIELDAYYDEVSKFQSSLGQPLQFSKPEFIATSPTAMKYVQDYINAFEKAIQASDYTTEHAGQEMTYSQFFDMDALTRYWLVQELFMNVDAMKKSTYLYKDIDGLFQMGPVWDMDWSSDSLVSQYESHREYKSWQTTYFSAQAQAKQWYKYIIQDPYFAVQAYELYTQMREEIGSIVADGGKMDACQELLLESAKANADKWYGADSQKGFITQAGRLKTFLKNRLNWMDQQFQSPEKLAESLGYRAAGGITVKEEDILAQASGMTAITANVENGNARSVEFLVNGKNLGTVEISGQKATLEMPSDGLLAAPSYNTVQVLALNANGSVIMSSGKKVMDFEKFQAKAPVDPDPDNPDPDNPDKPDPDNPDPDNPDKPDPDNPDPDNPDPDNPDKPDPDNPNPDNPDPDNPDKPDPDNPDKPDPDNPDPDNPDKPDPDNPDPDNPDKPDPDNPDPDNPDPDNPDKPDPDNPNPDNPDKPDPDNPNPDNPDKPDPDNPNPDNPNPDNPDKPNPDNPDKPNPDNPPAVGKILTDTKGKAQYKVTKSGKKGGTVEYYKNKNAKTASIKVPSTVTIGKITYKVTGIAEKAFKGNKKITKVTVGNNVTQIKKNSFSQCTNLKTVSLGKGITSIGDKAFYQCTALTQITLPGKVAKIGKQSFYGCKKMTKATIPASVKSIGSKAFANAPKLKTVIIKTTRLTSKNVGSNAFWKIGSKAVVKVPAKKLKAYKSLLKKRGISGKKQKITK